MREVGVTAAHEQTEPAVLRGPRVAHRAPDGLPGLVREQRLRTPDAIACQDPDRSLSYAELDALSDQLADAILAATGGRRGAVALRMHRQVEVLVAFLGVLKAGCYYVPIATTEPASRVRTMLDVVQPVCCVVSAGLDPLDWQGIPAVGVPNRVLAGPARPVPAVAADQPIYAMFTSGSTGTPKAVLVGSAGVCNRMLWMAGAFPLGPDDRFLQKTAYTFDVSGWEFYLPVITGGCCVFAPIDAHHDARAIARTIAEQRITICHFVPTMLEEYLRQLGAQDTGSLRMVFCSGEALPAGLAARFNQQLDAELHNLYGPTEASIEVTHWPVPAGLKPTGEVLIGAPIDNVDLQICDRDGQPLPSGEIGELWIGGVQVALGYLHQPELTAQAFRERDGQRWYRTGDLAQFVDGQVRYLGRTDAQVKIRGVRVEPGEVEAALVGHPAVGQAAVVPVQSTDGLELVAVVAGAEPLPEPGLLAYLGDRLPRAFVPRTVLWVDSLPLTSSGKADRSRIGQYAAAGLAASAALAEQAATDDPVAAQWWQTLGTAPDPELADVGFLNLGGHSLTAVRLLAKLADRFAVELPLSALLRDNLSLTGLRAQLAAADSVEPTAPTTSTDARRSPLTPAQEPVWLVSRLLADPSGYNVVGTLRVQADLDPALLHRAIDDLIVRHDALRAGILLNQGVPEWHYADRIESPSDTLRCRTVSALDDRLIEDFVTEIASSIIDPERPPLLRVGLLRTGTESVLTLALHHLIADLRTLEILVEELALAYPARAAGAAPSWPAPATSFAGFAHQRAATAHSPAWQRDLDYWQQLLADAPARTPLPFGLTGPDEPTLAGRRFAAELDEPTSRAIDAFLAERGYTSATYFLACISSVLAAWSGETAITVGMPVSQRHRAEQLDLVGFLLTTIPLRIEVADHPDPDGLLAHIRDRYLSALEHATPTVQAIAHRLGLPPSASDNPLFQVWVNDLSRTAPAPAIGDAPAEWLAVGRPAALFDLNYYLHRRSDGYRLELVCGADRYPDSVAEQLLRQVVELAAALLIQPVRFTPTDIARSAPIPVAELTAAVRRTAAGDPDAVAIRHAERDWSYSELLEAIDRTAEGLAEAGIGPTDLVELRAERSPALPVALLAAWQLGAAVAITDPGLPAAVLAEQSEQLRPSAILGLDDPGRPIRSRPGRPDARQLAGISHLLFTSGTSGRPAAVTVPPQALAAGVRWYHQAFELGPTDRVILLGGIGHDPLLRELLATLIAGGTLVIPPPDIFASPDRLFELLRREQVSVLNATPALLELIRSGRPAGARLDELRLVVSGGATLTAGLARAIRQLTPARLVNGYGTTETPQLASCYQVAGYAEPVVDDWPDSAGLPVGVGVNDARLGIRSVGPDGQPLPVGQVGEVVIDSPYLATGYLTETGRHGFDPSGTRYRTGDRGRLHPSGAVVLDGRLDRQLSLDGHRFDPEQVERAALRNPGVWRALARLRTSPAGELLTLSVIAAPDRPAPAIADLRAELRRQLPRYAVPAEIALVADFELSRNHKVTGVRPAAVEPKPTSDPSGSAEALSGWVSELIGIDLPPIENYFDAGLNSMAVVRLHAGLCERLGRSFPVTAMFQYPNLAALARFLDHSGESATDQQPVARSRDRRPTGQPAAGRSDRALQRRQLRQQIRHDSGGIR